MSDSKTNRLFFGSILLSNVLSITVIALTIYHHFSMQDKIEKLKRA